VIHVRTDEPDYADIEDIEDNWKYSGVYGHVSKPIADDIPPPLGKEVVTTTCVDAILCHDLITGHAATTIYTLLIVLKSTTVHARQLLRQQCMGQSLLQSKMQLTKLLTTVIHCIIWCPCQVQQCLVTINLLLPVPQFLTLDSITATMPCLIIMCMR